MSYNVIGDEFHQRWMETDLSWSELPGWRLWGSIRLASVVDRVQKDIGIQGGICEIGVYGGRFFFPLCCLRRDGETALAIDKKQEGDEVWDGFLSNTKKFPNVATISSNSKSLSPEQILEALGGQARIVSIDGGHDMRTVINDLEIGKEILADGGALIVDDVFDFIHPGVAEGFFRFFQGTAWICAAIGWKVCVMVRDLGERYREEFLKMPDKSLVKEFLGDKSVCFPESLPRQ